MFTKEEITNKLFWGDCLEIMKHIPDKSIDMILCDLPYGTTACKWDTIIPFESLWKEYKRIIKDNGVIVLTGSEPFSSYLRLSNIEWYKFDIYWKKEKPTNFFQLKRRFGKCVETISIFYKKQPTYNPQMIKHDGKLVKNKPKGNHNSIVSGVNKKVLPYKDTGFRYPNDVVEIRRDVLGTTVHPTQKPVALFEYLIKTYTNEGDLVLDNCAGSGTTGIACKNLKRKYCLIEQEEKYCEIIKERLQNG
jgi:site-specific DNA-methyltransferase (adenine-specific)